MFRAVATDSNGLDPPHAVINPTDDFLTVAVGESPGWFTVFSPATANERTIVSIGTTAQYGTLTVGGSVSAQIGAPSDQPLSLNNTGPFSAGFSFLGDERTGLFWTNETAPSPAPKSLVMSVDGIPQVHVSELGVTIHRNLTLLGVLFLPGNLEVTGNLSLRGDVFTFGGDDQIAMGLEGCALSCVSIVGGRNSLSLLLLELDFCEVAVPEVVA